MTIKASAMPISDSMFGKNSAEHAAVARRGGQVIAPRDPSSAQLRGVVAFFEAMRLESPVAVHCWHLRRLI
jgi:hypothetical protein